MNSLCFPLDNSFSLKALETYQVVFKMNSTLESCQSEEIEMSFHFFEMIILKVSREL